MLQIIVEENDPDKAKFIVTSQLKIDYHSIWKK